VRKEKKENRWLVEDNRRKIREKKLYFIDNKYTINYICYMWHKTQSIIYANTFSASFIVNERITNYVRSIIDFFISSFFYFDCFKRCTLLNCCIYLPFAPPFYSLSAVSNSALASKYRNSSRNKPT